VRSSARRPSAALLALGILLAPLPGCAYFDTATAPDVPVAVDPLSKVTVHNDTNQTLYARMNWPDGFVQVAPVKPGRPVWLTGAIGTSGFPSTIDVLTEDCAVVDTVRGLEPGNAGLITVDADGVRIERLVQGRSDWEVSGSVVVCGATPG
jgi:hypothetical protein